MIPGYGAPDPDEDREAFQDQDGVVSGRQQRRERLSACHSTFQRWLGTEYDLGALDAMLCTLAVERLTGIPIWLLIISGSGNAKTETAQAAAGAGAIVTSTLSSDAALLSGTSTKEKAKDATGGLLRKIGSSGVLVIKDVTSILSMGRELRGSVLAALREVYDGLWERNLGTDGGRTLTWEGRLAVIGAVTTAWDQAHEVIAAMGDRYVLVRVDSAATAGRSAAARRAIGNTGQEEQMRAELAEAVGAVIATIDLDTSEITDEETERLLAAADLVTLGRTAVIRDYRGDVIDAHAPEMPTRFAKQLAQIVRGGVAIGMNRREGLRLAIRCARDSMPPLRLAVLDDVAAHPHTTTNDVRKRLGKPRATIDRELQALHMLGVFVLEEEERVSNRGNDYIKWFYSVADHIDPTAITYDDLDPSLDVTDSSRDTRTVPEKSVQEGMGARREGGLLADIPGKSASRERGALSAAPVGGVPASSTSLACERCGGPLDTTAHRWCVDCVFGRPESDQRPA